MCEYTFMEIFLLEIMKVYFSCLNLKVIIIRYLRNI